MTAEQLGKFFNEAMDRFNNRATGIWWREDWTLNRELIIEFVKDMDSVAEVYDMENKDKEYK